MAQRSVADRGRVPGTVRAAPSPARSAAEVPVRRRLLPCLLSLAAVTAACAGEPPVPAAERSAAAATDAGCELRADGFDGDASHIELTDAPPTAELYDERPAIGGPHTPDWLRAGVYDAPVEERSAVHNLEHGAVAVWFDGDAPSGDVEALVAWAQDRNASGLLDERSGAGLLVAPYEEPLQAPFALRAWGVAADCEAFDPAFADAFVLDHFGSAGVAPEGNLGGAPDDAVPTEG